MKIKSLILTLFTFISLVGVSQMSYKEFHERYTPHNEKIVPDASLVKEINSMDTEKASNQIVNSTNDAYDGDDDSKIAVIAVLSSCDRSKVADILETMSTYNAVRTLSILKNDWIKELVYFVDLETYQNIAPYLVDELFIPYPEGPFGLVVKKWSPAYAGAFFNFGYSPLKGYNNIISKYGDNSTVHNYKGFGLTAGIYTGMKENRKGTLTHRFIDISYQNRSAKTKYESSFTNSKVGMNTLSINFLKGSTFSKNFMIATGMGIQGNLFNVSTIGSSGKTSVSKVINGGLNYNVQLFINPVKSLPVMLGIRGYGQINFPNMNFNPLNDKLFNLSTPSDIKDYKSSIATFGVQIQAVYKFGKAYVPKEYKDFDTELAETYDKSLNTNYDELAPRVSADGKTLYFIREDHPYNTKGSGNSQDIWEADISNGIDNATANHLNKPFNQKTYNSIIGISPDGNSMMIKGYYVNGQYEGKGFSTITKTKDGWSSPKGVKVDSYKNMTKGDYVGGYWSADGKHLILSFSESSSNNDQSLYVSHLQDDGNYSKPINISEKINEDGVNNHSPYLASDGKTLYFASNREGGEGSHDIWVIKRLDDTWTNWSDPVNLGPEINTEDWDAYYTIDAQGKYAYKVTYENSKANSADVVRIKLKEEVQPDPVVLVRGKVLDKKTNEPVSATIVYNGIDDGVNYGVAHSDPNTGEYTIVLPYGVNYEFTASASNYIGISNNLDLTQVGEYKEITKDLYLVPIEVGATVRLNNIFFETGKAELKASSFAELDRVVKFLNDNPNVTIEISGHTDNVGNENFNNTLSQQRAESVTQYLLSKGIDQSRLSSKGYGFKKPVADNSSEQGRALNRRVEFTILTNN